MKVKSYRETKEPLNNEEILQWLRQMRDYSHCPISNFAVSCVLKAKLGEKTYYFAGGNVENQEHELSICAEASAISAMTTALGKHAEIVELWVMAAPKNAKITDESAKSAVPCCGNCRQQISGFADDNTPINSVPFNGTKQSTWKISELLINAFNYKKLDPELIQKPSKDLVIEPQDIVKKLVRSEKLSDKDIIQWSKELEPRDFTTGISNVVIIKLSNGIFVAGAKVEDAAFKNISASRAAVANMVGSGFGNEKITEIWSCGENRNQDIDNKNYSALTLGATQVLNEFAQSNNIPLHLMNNKGQFDTVKLSKSSSFVPTTNNNTPEPIIKNTFQELISRDPIANSK